MTGADQPLTDVIERLGYTLEQIVVRAGTRGVVIGRLNGARELVTIVAGAIAADPLRHRDGWDLPLRAARLVELDAGLRTVIAESLPAGLPSSDIAVAGDIPPFATELVDRVAGAHAAGELAGPLVPELIFVDAGSRALVGVAQRPLRAEAAAETRDGAPVLYGLAEMTPADVRGEPAGPGEDVFRLSAMIWRWRHGTDPIPGRSSFDRLAALAGGQPFPALPADADALDALLWRGLALQTDRRPPIDELVDGLRRARAD